MAFCGALPLATSHPPDGRVVLAFGSAFLAISILEIVLSKRRQASAEAWAGRLLAIMVWVLMIFSGIYWLAR
jgi:hypothetical protein